MSDKFKKNQLPIVVLRNTTLFPFANQQLEMVRPQAIAAVRSAIDAGQHVFITMQCDPSAEDPTANSINHIGVVASVLQVMKGPTSQTMHVRVNCLYRACVTDIEETRTMLIGSVTELPHEPIEDESRKNALMKSLRETAIKYADRTGNKKFRAAIEKTFNLNEIINNDTGCANCICFVAHALSVDGRKKQDLLETDSLEDLCIELMSLIRSELENLELQREIEEQVKSNIERGQREYYLREQLKVIGEKLGDDGDSPAHEAEVYREKVASLDICEESRQLLFKSCDKLAKLPFGSHEAAVERNYIDVCLSLPWGKFSEEKLDVSAAQKKLDQDHYGMEKVKERILEFVAVRALAPDIKGQIICLVGPPGVGKTSIARSVAEALGRKYQRISLGGVHDEADIRGHRKTYIGAMPGRITNAMKLAGVMNPLILLDEVDKLASDFRGDPTSALLEVLDPEQNVSFHDHYVDLPIDLSNVMFITTANDAARIPAPLFDRMEVINLTSYTLEEKFHISKRHLIKKQTARHGLNGNQLRFTDKSIKALIDGYTREAGVRNLEREIASLCRKAAKQIATGHDSRITITDKLLPEYLGPAKHSNKNVVRKSEVGIVNGLAYTSVGGTILEVEVAILEGTGKIELTGSLGDVLKESAHIAISLIRSRAEALMIDPDFYKNKDIHVHFPEGATPKDGPSAGIAMTTAIVSALSGIPARGDIAMTGEITLRGRVLAIGGLREKSMAAYVNGIKTVIIPADNEPDVTQLSDAVRDSITFIPVSDIDTVLENALDFSQAFSGVNSDGSAILPLLHKTGGKHETGESRV